MSCNLLWELWEKHKDVKMYPGGEDGYNRLMRKTKIKRQDIGHHGAAVNRLKRASGHLSKVIDMLASDRPCGEVLQQLSAVISALGSARAQLLQDHLNSCLEPVVGSKHKKLIREIDDVIKRAMKV